MITEPALDITETKCEFHPREFLSFFCGDHNLTGCGRCLLKEHKLCQDISDLVDIKENGSVVKEIETFRAKLSSLENLTQELEPEITTRNQISIKNRDENLAEVDDFIEDITAGLRRLQNDLKSQINSKHEKNIDNIKRALKACTASKELLEQASKTTQEQYDSKLLGKLYIYMRNTATDLDALMTALNEAKESQVKTYEFKKDKKILEIIHSSDSAIGKVEDLMESKTREVHLGSEEGQDKQDSACSPVKTVAKNAPVSRLFCC